MLICVKKCWMSGKQCRPWSDATFCGIWSGSTLFDKVYLSQYLSYYGKIQSLDSPGTTGYCRINILFKALTWLQCICRYLQILGLSQNSVLFNDLSRKRLFFFFFGIISLSGRQTFMKKKNLHITAAEKRGYYPHDIFLASPMEQVACNEYYNIRFCGEITKSIITFQLKRSPLSEAMYIFFIVGKIFNPPNHIVLWKYEN